MMLDIYAGTPAENGAPTIRNAEFFRIELSGQRGGKILVALTATTVDEDEPQLLDQEIARNSVSTIDDVLALIKAHVRIAEHRHRGLGAPKTRWYRNHYRCARCNETWTDEWSATCDDDCPHCGARHMSPYKSEDVEDGDG
jgi:DNA-directed RNA polymerase subunit RPC12/RpoP